MELFLAGRRSDRVPFNETVSNSTSSNQFKPLQSIQPRPPQNWESLRSRLGQSLLCLHQSMEQTRLEETRAETAFTAWQEKWSSGRDRISKRLALIESQLADFARQSEPENAFQLSVVRFVPESDEPVSMSES